VEPVCQIDRSNSGKEIRIPGDRFCPALGGGMIFYICDQCIEESICPQCKGCGQIDIKHGTSPVARERCDLCLGSGEFDYKSLT
jgi:DnaJ-class molecular chaperone